MRDLIHIADAGSVPRMHDVFRILNGMRDAGVIGPYALCGAMAAFEYIEPFSTCDVDVTVELGGGPVLDLSKVTGYLEQNGMAVQWEGEGLMIAGYPVQLIPPGSDLDRDALAHADALVEGDLAIPIWRAEYLMAKCLEVGRPKDEARLNAFLDVRYDQALFCALIHRHALTARWQRFCRRFEREDACGSPS